MINIFYYFVFFLVSVVNIQVVIGEKRERNIHPVCLQPTNPGGCKLHITRYTYNSSAGRCEKFDYTGCGSNLNHFLSMAECRQVCNEQICFGWTETGTCNLAIPRFTFNFTAARCEEFTWSGCGGNSNNFMTIEECRSVCDSDEF